MFHKSVPPPPLTGPPLDLVQANGWTQTCISTLTMRHLALGGGPIEKIDDLRAPMTDVLTSLAEQLAELQQYKARFGELSEFSSIEDIDGIEDISGSDTEQE